MSAVPEKRESRSAVVLRILAGQPEELPLRRVAELAGGDMDGPDRYRVSTHYASTLSSLEERGYVQRTGTRQRTMWSITAAGREALASDSLRAAKGSFTHGTNSGYNGARCRCARCRAWFHAYFQKWYPGSNMQKRGTEYSRQWRAENPEKSKAKDRRAINAMKARNAESRDAATRHGSRWTGPELEILSREELSTAEAAVMLGRTLRSVQTMRSYLKDGNPRDRMLRDGPPPTSRSGPR